MSSLVRRAQCATEAGIRGPERSPSTVSDCYSNDEEYTYNEYSQLYNYNSTSKDNPISSNTIAHLPENSPKKNEIYSGRPIKIAQSNFEISRNQNSTFSDTNIKHLTDILVDQENSSQFNEALLKSKENYSLRKGLKRTDGNFRYDRNFNATSISFSGLSAKNNPNLYKKKDGVLDPCENTISNSLFDFSRKTSDSYIYPEGDLIKSFVDKNKGHKISKVPIGSDREMEPKDNTEYSIKGDFVDNNLVNNICKKVPIKNITHSSNQTQMFKEHLTQTSNQNIYKEICVGTTKCSKDTEIQDLIKINNKLEKNIENKTQIPSLDSTMDILKLHVDKLISHTAHPYRTDYPIFASSANNQIRSPNHNLQIYNERTINNLYFQIKEIYSLLNAKMYPIPTLRQPKHQRSFSESVKNNLLFFASGDFVEDQELELTLPSNRDYAERKNVESFTNQVSEKKVSACRIFELNPYDDLIKSYQSHSDRRIKAVGNKMKCKILINGPHCAFDSTTACWNMRNKTAYLCSISGTSKEVVDKCLKCLQDTFPLSCLNEKRIFNKF